MVQGKQLFEEVVTIVMDFFGPAAPRYVERLIDHHLQKQPEKLQLSDLPKLTQWIVRTTAMLTEDEEELNTLQKRLHDLHNSRPLAGRS